MLGSKNGQRNLLLKNCATSYKRHETYIGWKKYGSLLIITFHILIVAVQRMSEFK